eukprot:1148878-Pelagomonas_calceolata.AAC.1
MPSTSTLSYLAQHAIADAVHLGLRIAHRQSHCLEPVQNNGKARTASSQGKRRHAQMKAHTAPGAVWEIMALTASSQGK